MTKFKVIDKKPSKNGNLSQKPLFLTPPGGSKRGENEFLGKKRKRHSLKFPNTKLHAKNQKNLSCGFPGKQGETERQTDRETETDPNIRVLRTLSLSRQTKKRVANLWSSFIKKPYFMCMSLV